MTSIPTIIKTSSMQRAERHYANSFNNGEYTEIQDLFKSWLSDKKNLQFMSYHLGISSSTVTIWIKNLQSQGIEFGEFDLTTVTDVSGMVRKSNLTINTNKTEDQ